MECYNCGAPLTGADYCAKCGADVRIYKKILSASNSFYNEGLERASVRDLSGAIECLKKSLQLNKMNTDARNLLGLVYFEMGETVSALGEWVISKNQDGRDNIADTYLHEMQNNTSLLNTVNQTIKKYNQALIYCQQGSEDLAVIQLKKILSINPKLVKAHQLLALLYIRDRKYDLARKSLRAAEKIDRGNTTTMGYLAENGVTCEEYDHAAAYLKSCEIDGKVWCSCADVSYMLYKLVQDRTELVDKKNPTELMKAVKNPVELEHIRECYIRDSAALTKFLFWMKENAGKTAMDELSVAAKLDGMRAEIPGFLDLSFPTISAYKANAAMAHYSATEEHFSRIDAEGLYLVDSGGQYEGGTTDVTRTMALGAITDEMKINFTQGA